MRAIPRWFKRQLKNIDPRAEIEYDQEYNFFNIYIEVDIHGYADGRKQHRKERLLKGCYRDLDSRAVADLEYRHWMAQRYNAKGDRRAYMKKIASDNNEARAKQRKLADEYFDEGAKEMGKLARGRQSWTMGG